MRGLLKKESFSLIELIMVIAMTSIILPMMAMIVGGMTQQMTKARQITIATDLAREMMDTILSKRFDENQPVVLADPGTIWTPVANLGSDGGDSDDVDDFITSAVPISGLPGYTRSVEVVYGSSPFATVSGSPTNYKRITVNVTGPTIGTIFLVTLVGGWGN